MKHIKKILSSVVPYLIMLFIALVYIIWINKLKSSKDLSPENFISNITIVFGWAVLLLTGFIHLQKLRKDSQTAKREEIRKSLEREAFREINRAITKFSHILTKIHIKYLTLPGDLTLYIQHPNVFTFDNLRIEPELRSEVIDLLNGLTEFILAIEANEIVVIKFDHLRMYIQFKAYDVNRLIEDFLMYFGNIEKEKLLTKDGQSEFKEKCDKVYKKLLDIQFYLSDYRIELMNSFYAEIFDDKVLIRKPKDPNCKILTEVAIKEDVEKEEQEREERAFREGIY